MTNLTHISFIL